MEGQKPETKSDEIDLGQLFSRIGSGIHNMWMGSMRFLAVLRRVPLENKLPFVLIILSSITIGIIFSLGLAKNYYESKMILSSDYLNKKLAENIIDKLDAMTGEPSKTGLAITLNLPDSVAAKIVGFDIQSIMTETDVVEVEILKEQLRTLKVPSNEEVIDNVMERIEIENRNAYEITVRTLSSGVVPKLEEAIVNHLRSYPYIRKRVEINKQNLVDLKTRLRRDINKMDSLKTALSVSYGDPGNKGSTSLILNDKTVDPSEVFTQSLKIYKLYDQVNTDLYTQKDFEIVDGFTQFSEPANASVIRVILESLLIGIVLGYLVIGLRHFNEYLANLK